MYWATKKGDPNTVLPVNGASAGKFPSYTLEPNQEIIGIKTTLSYMVLDFDEDANRWYWYTIPKDKASKAFDKLKLYGDELTRLIQEFVKENPAITMTTLPSRVDLYYSVQGSGISETPYSLYKKNKKTFEIINSKLAELAKSISSQHQVTLHLLTEGEAKKQSLNHQTKDYLRNTKTEAITYIIINRSPR